MEEWTVSDLLPGVYVAVSAAGLGRLLRRWYDPVPAAAWVVFCLAIAALFGPALFGGRVLQPLDNLRGYTPFTRLPAVEPHGNFLQGDLIQLIAPSRDLAREDLLSGRWPLWNPFAGAGVPLLADPQAQALQPLTLWALPFDPARGAGVIAASRVLCALVFMYLLLRRQRLTGGAALTGALAYGLGGFVLLWLGWPIANTAAWLPTVLYAVTLCLDLGRRRDLLLLTVTTFGLLTAGHPETILYALALVAVFCIRPPGGMLDRSFRRTAVEAAATMAIAAAIAAPAILPALRYLPETARAEQLKLGGEEEAFGSLDRLARTWVPVAAPNAFGNSRYAHYWGRDNTNEDASGFVGSAALLAALLAAAGIRRRRPREGLVAGATLASLLLIAQPPGWAEAVRNLPLLGGLCAHGNHRLLLLVSFGLAYLAACTVDRYERGEGPPWPVLAAAAAGLGSLVAWASLSFPHPQDPALLEVLRIGWLHWHLRFLAAAALVLAALSFAAGRAVFRQAWQSRRFRRALTAGFAMLVAGELILAHRAANPPMPSRLDRPAPPVLTALAERLRAGASGERFVGLGRTLPPNVAGLYRLADARIYNPVTPAAYARMLAPLILDPRANVPELAVADHPALDLLSVRWVLAPPGADLERKLRATPVHRDADGALYERPGALPPLFLPPSAVSGPPGGWRAWLAAAPDPRRVAWVAPEEGAGEVSAEGGWREVWKTQARTGNLGSLDRVSLDPISFDRAADAVVQGRARLSQARLVTTSIYRQPNGWRLLVDGEGRPTVSVNGPLLGFWLPSGESWLTLIYRAPGLLPAAALAALGLAALALLLLRAPPNADSGNPSEHLADHWPRLDAFEDEGYERVSVTVQVNGSHEEEA